MPAVEVSALTKSYDKSRALEDVSFSVAAGELFCITGADGAGKSTLLRILAGTLRPDAGRVALLGQDGIARQPDLRYRVGYMPQRFAIYADLTAEENLDFYCTFYGLDRAGAQVRSGSLLRLTRLERFRRFQAGNLSGGMKQKLVLACALVHEPELLILDEPTTGIDPLSRREFWAILTDYLAQGRTIVYSSVYLEEALRSNRIAIMRSGRIAACDTPENLLAGVRHRRFVATTRYREQTIAALNACPAVRSVQPLGTGIAFLLGDSADALDTVRKTFADSRLGASIEPAQPTLEDVLIVAGQGHDPIPPGESGSCPAST